MPHKKSPQNAKIADKPTVLIVEDDQDFALGLSLMLKQHTFCAEAASTLGEALRRLETQRFDVILLDLSLPDASGIRVISSIREQQPDSGILVLTGHNDAQLAVQALRLGAKDYLTKPIRKHELLQAVETAYASVQIHQSSLRTAPSRTQSPPSARTQQSLAIGDSHSWLEAIEMIQAAASAPKTTILLTGEPGVGKEVAARLIHQWSQRAEQVMLAVNVAGLPGTLLESELFGHEVGAFTGASTLKRGLFEQAEKGTLFLDEIGELPLELQAKLLRVLEGQPFRRLGGEKDIFPKARLISATNRPLESLIAQGLFREDLYHRLKVLEIRLPSLRERQPDIEKLALHFLAHLGAEMGHSRAYFAPETIALFQRYPWPGNVRELRNVVERALVLSRGEPILPRHLPRELREMSLDGRETPASLATLGQIPAKNAANSTHSEASSKSVSFAPVLPDNARSSSSSVPVLPANARSSSSFAPVLPDNARSPSSFAPVLPDNARSSSSFAPVLPHHARSTPSFAQPFSPTDLESSPELSAHTTSPPFTQQPHRSFPCFCSADPSALFALDEAHPALRLEQAILHHIQSVLGLCDGNVTRAAEILGITRQTLRRRLRETTLENHG